MSGWCCLVSEDHYGFLDNMYKNGVVQMVWLWVIISRIPHTDELTHKVVVRV